MQPLKKHPIRLLLASLMVGLCVAENAYAISAEDILSTQAQLSALEKQKLQEEALQEELAGIQANTGKKPRYVSNYCLLLPLPQPKSPSYVTNIASGNWLFPGNMKLTFWREKCRNGSGTALMMRAQSNDNPLLCGKYFKITQGGYAVHSYYPKLRQAPNGYGFCGQFRGTSTFIFDIDGTFNLNNAFTVVHDDGYSVKKLSIPAKK